LFSSLLRLAEADPFESNNLLQALLSGGATL